MNPVHHARSASRRFGGSWQDFVQFHSFFDQSKAAFPSVQHRIFLHTDDLGRALAKRVFGETLAVPGTDGISVDKLVDQHIREDLGTRIRLDDWLAQMRVPRWIENGHLRALRLTPEDEAFREDPTGAAARTFGGRPDEYQPVLDILRLGTAFSDRPAAGLVLTNSLGIFIAEQALGYAIETADGHIAPTRLVAERMTKGLLGRLPTPQDICLNIQGRGWMRGELVRQANVLWPDYDHAHEHDSHDEHEEDG